MAQQAEGVEAAVAAAGDGGGSSSGGCGGQAELGVDVGREIEQIQSSTKYLVLPSVGYLGQAMRLEPDELAVRCGRVRRGQSLHSLGLVQRSRSDQASPLPESLAEAEQRQDLSETWIKVHCISAPLCEAWVLVRRGTKVYLQAVDAPAEPEGAIRPTLADNPIIKAAGITVADNGALNQIMHH